MRALGIGQLPLLEFLMIEHMRHGGKRNGLLLAPRRQLVEAGIRPHDISGAIEEVPSGSGLSIASAASDAGRASTP